MTSPEHPGIFVAFEGGEGSGKTTQITRLRDRLTSNGHQVTVTREPGATRLGHGIRRMLLDPGTGHIDPRAEALLYAADRAQHAATVIRPALASGATVLTDRYMDSSVAYQGAGRDLDADEIRSLSMWATGDLTPDLTLILDLDPTVGLARATATEFGSADRIESERIEFHRAVRAGFLTLAAAAPHRYTVLDATANPETLAADVWAAVDRVLRARLPLAG